MKKIYLILLIALGSLSVTSCNKWLDVQPQDIVDADDLFAEGMGYRNALNGVYRELSSHAMYGSILSYGVVEAMAQMYNSYSMHSSAVHLKFMKYDYADRKVKSNISSLWETAYTTIANCNSIIVNISNEPASKFRQGEREKELILGEALAIRGFVHFLMACYFAPAPIANPTGAWIPYYDSFPLMGAPYLTVNECLARCIEDLKLGQEYVKTFDTYTQGTNTQGTKAADEMLLYPNRFETENDYTAGEDVFINYRGYRMNYPAITAILARVYSYAGKYDLAATEAQTVIDFASSKQGVKAFRFTRTNEAETDYKLTPDLIFTLSEEQLLTTYVNDMLSNPSYVLSMDYNYSGKYFDCESDYRKTKLLNTVGWDLCPVRYTMPKKSGSITAHTLDMLPVIRLSEMYYIMAEGFAAQANYTDATEALDIVREGRGCPRGLLNGKINDSASFKRELLNEARREFIQEGLTFYYFKKYGEKFTSRMADEAWYFPRPDSENIN